MAKPDDTFVFADLLCNLWSELMQLDQGFADDLQLAIDSGTEAAIPGVLVKCAAEPSTP